MKEGNFLLDSQYSNIFLRWFDRKMVKQLYMDLNNSNRELLHEYQIRSQNYRDMVESLRKMNMIIQKFANLRSE